MDSELLKLDNLDKQIVDKILAHLSNSEVGSSSSNIARHTGHNRITISKYLQVMYAKGFVNYQKIGQSRLWKINNEITKPKILIVDDDPNVVRLINLSLGNKKYKIYEAFNGFQALEIAKNNTPDVVILDLMMTGMSGYETCKKLREMPKLKKTKIIILSAKNQIDDKIKGLEEGADDYMIKPFDPLELESRINLMLNNLTGKEKFNDITKLPSLPLIIDNLKKIEDNTNFNKVMVIEITNLEGYKSKLGIRKSTDLLILISRIIKEIADLNECFLGHYKNNFFIITDKDDLDKKINYAFENALPYFYNGDVPEKHIKLDINKFNIDNFPKDEYFNKIKKVIA